MSPSQAALAVLLLVPAVPLPEEVNTATREPVATSPREAIRSRWKQIAETTIENGKEANLLQEKVWEGVRVLLDSEQPFPHQFAAPANLGNQQVENQFKQQLVQHQMNTALWMFKLDTILEELDSMKDERGKQSETWRAYYDYVRGHLAGRIAQLYEYNAQLGSMRKEFPPLDPDVHKGWQLVPAARYLDRDAGKYGQRARQYLQQLSTDQPGRWEGIVKQEMPLIEGGLQWEGWSKR